MRNHKNLTKSKKSAITYKVTKKLQKLQTSNFYCKGDYIISSFITKAVSVLLGIMFILGSAITVNAEEVAVNSGEKFSSADASLDEYRIVKTIAPEKVQTLKVEVSDIGERSAVISWQSAEDCSSYVIYRYDDDGQRAEACAVTNETKVELKNLQPDTEQKFVIASGFSDKALGNVSFKTEEETPYLTLSDVTSSTVEIKAQNIQSGSSVVLLRGTSESDMKKITDINGDTYTDKNLDNATEYYYSLEVTTPSGNVKKSNTESVKTLLSMGLPSVSGSTKTYAHYTAVTAKSSPQYKLLNSSECYTDSETGIRMIGDCYCVALGSYYGSTIGTKYRITFSTGKSIKVILCDQKSDRHTDSNHQYAVKNEDIIEFYVQRSKIPSGVRGNHGNLEQFDGNVVSIEKYV